MRQTENGKKGSNHRNRPQTGNSMTTLSLKEPSFFINFLPFGQCDVNLSFGYAYIPNRNLFSRV